MTALAALFAMIVVDCCWAKYAMACADRRAIHAALWSGAIVLGGSVTTLALVASPWNVVPSCLGAVVGTWWTVKRG